MDWGIAVFQVVACITAFTWIMNTYRKEEGKARAFWLFLGLGILSYLLGIVVWAFYHFTMTTGAEAAMVPKILWISQNVFYFIALLLIMSVMKKNNLLTIRFLLDILIVMSVAGTFIWFFIMDPLIKNFNQTFSYIDILYPILDLGVLAGVISLVVASNSIFTKTTSYLLIFGLLVQIIADLIFSYLTVKGVYTVGSITEPLWILSLFIISLASIHHEPFIGYEDNKSILKNKPKGSLFLKHSLPYIGVILLSIYVISELQHSTPIVIGLFFSILLVILRQVFTLLDNDRLVSDLNNLNEALEIKVKERTDRLVETINQMEHFAFHDVVTGLPNRRYIEKRLAQAIKNRNPVGEKKIAFLLLDLDRFKQINDSLGHSYGDLLLKEVGRRLSQVMHSNELVCRIGGDEYAILLENVTMSKIERKAELILQVLRKVYDISGVDLHVTPSIGISIYPEHGENFEALLMKADTAMYKVKENGKNHFKLYQASMDMVPQLALENSLRKALDRSEFVLYYQPQLSLETGQIIGVEALIRWISPSRGFVPPSEFISIAEETGLILPLGDWVLREACKQSVTWENQGIPRLRVAVNISSIQFQQTNFVKIVANIIAQTGANPDNIELEITESIAMGSMENTIFKLSQLKEMGFHIAMDDFGTGYSSLQYMNKFPIDRLKIDRSFISLLNTNEKNDAIVKLIVMMAKGLNFKVIAEGVETIQQRTFLEQIDCDEIQGYLISKPLKLEDCNEFLNAATVSCTK
ncbi:putative bifunctional diguanylate cyclase/phosphodiesterase [Anaerobacillus alkaliphilus]|uniref:putative bifunctional diguanylate cyclase/phosphodiesterase n=1 Tax=Anaerobacillus alkaliphilus TaxID=1548597 RepID=UPI0013758C6F|nr:EAL domain-containing protein [Anaerobacillus alkaliphilus]